MGAEKFVVGFLIGGAVGAIAGLLFAPQSGKETREQIAKSSKDIYDKTETAVRQIQSKADDIVSDIQDKGEDLLEKIQSTINKQKEAVD